MRSLAASFLAAVSRTSHMRIAPVDSRILVSENTPGNYTIFSVSSTPVVSTPGTPVTLTAVIHSIDGSPVPEGVPVRWEIVSGQLYISLSGNTSNTDIAGQAVIQAFATAPSGGIVDVFVDADKMSASLHFSDLLLGAPAVVNAETDHQLDPAEMAHGVTVYVPDPTAYYSPKAGELIIFYWDDIDQMTYVLPDPPVFPFMIDAKKDFKAACFNDGQYQLFYDYIDLAQNIHSSMPFALEIVGNPPPTTLPAPTFPDANASNTITYASIMANGGADMSVSWPGMVEGDTVTASWFGFQTSASDPIPGTLWASDPHVLSADEVVAQEALFHIPSNYILPIGDGQGEGQYQVIYLQGGTALSATKDVNIGGELTQNYSTDAPVFDPAVPIRPMNSVNLTGPAGAEVVLVITNTMQAHFYPSGQDTLQLKLDETGYGVAQIYSFAAETVSIDISLTSKPTSKTSVSMRFTEWTPGKGELLSYGVATGSRADGKSYCSVYLQATYDSTATVAQLKLTGNSSAMITQSNAQIAIADVQETHACEFQLTDTVAETVTFTLALVDVAGSEVDSKLSFS